MSFHGFEKETKALKRGKRSMVTEDSPSKKLRHDPDACIPDASKKNSNNNNPTPKATSSTPKEITLGKRTEGDGAGPLKTLYKKAFARVTLTLGSTSGCLKRATNLSPDDAKQVADRIESAADIINNARFWPVAASTKIPLSKPKESLAIEIHTSIRNHFTKLPETIVAKMKKLKWDDDQIPQLHADQVDDRDDTDQETTDCGIRFKPGHIKFWWYHQMKLPGEDRSVGYGQTPIWRALPQVFVGEPDDIKSNSSKKQTAYGKSTTTMDRVSGSTPLTHGHEALRSYLLELYGYSRERKAWKDSPPEGRAEQDPPLPPDRPNSPKKRDRYVLSNIIRCDGLQVHALVYDLRKPHQSPHARSPIPNIEKAFPTRESIDGHFHDKPNTVIVGMDPGETVTATFCALDPQVPVQVKSLTVKRAALHAPILDFRRQMQDKKANSITDMESRLPSIQEDDLGAQLRLRVSELPEMDLSTRGT
ncbi:hypothetical protein B0O80DRAFT_528719 [Mortierella sp. GBAus27b]|nr:hypothetical protein B0O80DRAFT_528719 [Mortierella sp. GBAus27b]